jgi:hypothetical protein
VHHVLPGICEDLLSKAEEVPAGGDGCGVKFRVKSRMKFIV